MSAGDIVAAPAILDPESRAVFAEMAKLIDLYMVEATGDHRQQLVQLTSLLRHTSAYNAAVSRQLAETAENYSLMCREADYYAGQAEQLREERDRLQARLDELEPPAAQPN